MAELALALNIIEAVKQTYHVAQFIFEAVKSARNEDVERQQLTTDFGRELLFLASFQRYFEKAHGSIAYDQALDEVGVDISVYSVTWFIRSTDDCSHWVALAVGDRSDRTPYEA